MPTLDATCGGIVEKQPFFYRSRGPSMRGKLRQLSNEALSRSLGEMLEPAPVALVGHYQELTAAIDTLRQIRRGLCQPIHPMARVF